jgi:hypothetical protein
MINRESWIVAAAIGLMFTPLVRGQDKPARLTFEVASIKPAQAGPHTVNRFFAPVNRRMALARMKPKSARASNLVRWGAESPQLIRRAAEALSKGDQQWQE